jgi:hypothetical protein
MSKTTESIRRFIYSLMTTTHVSNISGSVERLTLCCLYNYRTIKSVEMLRGNIDTILWREKKFCAYYIGANSVLENWDESYC